MTEREPSPTERSIAAHLRALDSWGVTHARRESGSPLPATGSAPTLPTSTSVASSVSVTGQDSTPSPGSTEGVEGVLAACRAEVAACVACPLHEKRKQTVFGVGSSQASLMFVGEGPGADEDRLGEPFVGKAGQLLDKIIGAMGLSRAEVYIANVVKCRPPGNRTPTPQEVATCTPYLERQIEAIGPKLIVALGRPASNYLLNSDAPVGRLRGRKHDYHGIPVVVTYHPAYLLRSPAAKKDTWLDLQVVIEQLALRPPQPYQK